MLDGSHWMTIWVTSTLLDLGISEDDIKWSAAAGEDELDMVVKILREYVFFELKDREFGLGDAYPFGSRLQRYGGSAGVIVSTGSVAEEVKKYIGEQARRSASPIHAVEGIDNLSANLRAVIDDVAKLSVRRIVTAIFDPMGG